MGTKHSLSEYSFAKEVVEHFPQIQRDLNDLYRKIQPHEGFFAVNHVIEAINQSSEMLDMQYKHYKKVLETKGKV